MNETQRIHVTEQREAAETVAALLQSARHRIDVLSPRLDPLLYDQPDCLEALRNIVVEARRHARARFLVADVSAVISRGHRMIELSRQLSTYIEIRRLSADDRDDETGLLIVDNESYLHWEPGAGYQGTGRWHSRGTCRRHAQWFQECWDRSEPDPSLRRLHL